MPIQYIYSCRNFIYVYFQVPHAVPTQPSPVYHPPEASGKLSIPVGASTNIDQIMTIMPLILKIVIQYK